MVQSVKLLLPCLDLVWHKYKITTLRAFSEERPEVAWKGKVSCSHWYAAREEKSDSQFFFYGESRWFQEQKLERNGQGAKKAT